MFILTYQKLYNKIRSLKDSAYSDGILIIVEDGQERGFGIRRFGDQYIYGEIGWAGDTLDGFGFDMGRSLKVSKEIDDVILGYIDYISEDFNDENPIWNGTELRYDVPVETYFKCFKDGSLSIKLNLDDYNIIEWE